MFLVVLWVLCLFWGFAKVGFSKHGTKEESSAAGPAGSHCHGPAVDVKEQALVQREGLPAAEAPSEAVCLGNGSKGRWGLSTGRDPGKGIVFSRIKEK